MSVTAKSPAVQKDFRRMLDMMIKSLLFPEFFRPTQSPTPQVQRPCPLPLVWRKLHCSCSLSSSVPSGDKGALRNEVSVTVNKGLAVVSRTCVSHARSEP